MTKLSKRSRAIKEKVDTTKLYSLTEALNLAMGASTVKFVESLDVSINLGIDTRQSNQTVRGSVVLPNGTGKTVKVAVFTDGTNVQAAKDAGADLVGLDDLAEIVKKGELDVDVVIASPDAMKVVGRLGQILGPKGLMPNPKDGTVSADVAAAVKNAKAGQVRFRADKNGIVHASVGKANFKEKDLVENITSLLETLKKLKPISMKGVYLSKMTISTTMGPGLQVDLSSIS